jgi:hypothetical protein
MKPAFSVLVILAAVSTARALEFNRDIRPILSENCFACHGPDSKARKAKLRLDVAGADWSEVIKRVTNPDPGEVMPPPESHKMPLTPAQVNLLRQWITEGAKYQKHWAFAPLQASAGDIDSIVEATLKRRGLAFSPEAAPQTLIRRVCLDLTGLPPSEAQLGKSYEAVVDELLASPHFGEHLAVAWLDAARYADTNGYFGDKPRQMWLWRDWVIDAFNENLPFDRFSIEQLAGDLLQEATIKQRIATGFNRNHMANNESGSIDEEFRVEYVVDRVSTTTATWLGLTAGCAQCHDHKYDPISQREFYQLFAFFNNVPEKGLIREDDPPPVLRVPAPEQERDLQAAAAESQAAKSAFEPHLANLASKIRSWEKAADQFLPSPPSNSPLHESFNGKTSLTSQGTMLIFEQGLRGEAAKFDATQHVEAAQVLDLDAPWSIGLWVNAEGSLSCPLSVIEPRGRRRGLELIWQKGRLQVNLVHEWGSNAIEASTVETLSAKSWHHILVGYDGQKKAAGLRVYFDGKPTTLELRRDTLTGSMRNAEPMRLGRRDANLGYYGLLDELRLVQSAVDDTTARDWFWGERIRGIVETESPKRSPADTETLLDYYIDQFGDPTVKKSRARLKSAVSAEKNRRDVIPTVLVMEELPQPRPAHVLERGQYDQPREAVTPGVPEAIAPWKSDLPPNRLGFARWLFLPENPLTARVAANRLWQQCFGEGLVRTVDDFGSQGEPPAHPELLDWLALEFQKNWDVKALLKRIVMSRTYRQSSAHRDQTDLPNQWLARGPGGRLSAEMLRDQALAVSGLLARRVGGPSVRPYQPPGLWEAVSYNGEESYVVSVGEDQWRRSLYTYVKRQSPPPGLLTFDGPTREKCTLRRPRTNTPLQALQLLNDETFVKAAEALAKRSEGQQDRVAWMFRAVTARDADPEELAMLHGLLKRRQSHAVVAHTILNLDEAIAKR